MLGRNSAPIVLLLAVGLTGCDSRSSVLLPAPTPSAAPSPTASVGSQLWNLTVTYAGHTGPAACLAAFDPTVVQAPIVGTVAIRRSDDSIDVTTEHDHYVGTVVGDAYSATDSDTGSWQCGATRFNFRTEGHVSGNFSADGRSLTGEEGVVFRLESGDTITRRWVWSATRQ